MHQFNNLNRILEIGENHLESYLQWNNQNIPNMPITKYDHFIELITLLCNHGLATYELLKRFFLETLDLELLNSKTNSKIIKTSTWGTLTMAISKLTNVNEQISNELFDIDFRNTLAHDSWYLDEGSMRYVAPKNKKEIAIPYARLHEKIQLIFVFYHVMTDQYFRLYFPEMTQEYENGLGKVMDIIFPLYIASPRQDDVQKSSQP